MKTKNHNVSLLAITAIAIALAFVAAATIVYPSLEAHASNAISESRNKGQRGFEQSGGQGGISGQCGHSCGE
jgi:hypothetical protein